MPVKCVVKLGNKKLATPSLPVKNFAATEFLSAIQDMQDTMHEKNGVGIAAPQIGYNKRIIMFGFEKNARYPNEMAIPLTVLVNPRLVILDHATVDGWEGCLSVPGLRGLVPRFKKIHYSGYDQNGNPIASIAEGFHARVVQHEYDHIDGILFPQRIKDIRFFGFEDEIFPLI